MTTKPKEEIKEIKEEKKYKFKTTVVPEALLKYEVKKVKELNVHQKLEIIQTSNVWIEKSGYNAYAKHKYKTFTDIKRSVYELLNDLHLTIEPSNKAETINIQTEQGKKATIIYLRTWKVVNTDLPSDNFEWVEPSVASNETLDKAYGSSGTYSLKYLFNIVFLIPDEALDVDSTEVTEAVSEAIKEEKSLKEEIINIGKKHKDKWLEFKKENNINKIEEITEEHLTEMRKW